MTAATQNSLGTIILAGDLRGGSDPYNPTLSPSGVTEGVYSTTRTLYVDSKGRIVWISPTASFDIVPATKVSKGTIQPYLSQVGSFTLSGDAIITPVISTSSVSNNYVYSSNLGIVKIGSGISVTDGVISLAAIPDATTSTAGLVQIGEGLSISNGNLSFEIANTSTTNLGIMKVGSGLSVTGSTLNMSLLNASLFNKGIVQVGSGLTITDGVLALPVTTTTSKGIMKVGTGLNVSNGVLSANTISSATTSTKGIVQIGENISVSSGTISIPNASTSNKGLVIVGSGINVSSGVISISDSTNVNKGLVQVGEGLSVTNGVLSTNLSDATTTTKGIVQPGSGLSVDSNGILYVPLSDATTTSLGIARVGENISISDGVLSLSYPPATTSTYGSIRIGEGFGAVFSAYFDSVVGSDWPYLLYSKVASTTIKGLMQVGDGLSVTDGVVSTNIPDATTTSKGLVQVGDGLSVTNGVLSLNTSQSYANATTTSKGIVQIGSGLSITSGILSLANATITSKGIVQIGSRLSVTDGIVSTNIQEVSSTNYGLVQVGDGLVITNGVLSKAYWGAIATSSSLGSIRLPLGLDTQLNSTNRLRLDELGTLYISFEDAYGNFYASSSVKGLVQVGTGLSVTDGVLSIPDTTTTSKGLVQIGSGLGITSSGALHLNYDLPEVDNYYINEQYGVNTYHRFYRNTVDSPYTTGRAFKQTTYQLSGYSTALINYINAGNHASIVYFIGANMGTSFTMPTPKIGLTTFIYTGFNSNFTNIIFPSNMYVEQGTFTPGKVTTIYYSFKILNTGSTCFVIQ